MTDNKRGSSQAATPDAAEAQHGPPLPKWMYGVVNPVMKGILRSPLHRFISNDLMVLRFHGRKSGKQYELPVGYLQRGNELFLFSHTAWHVNLRNGAPVTVRLRGKDVRGTAEQIEDPRAITEVLRMFVAKRGEAMAHRMGLIGDGQTVESAKPPAGTYFIRIQLEEQP